LASGPQFSDLPSLIKLAPPEILLRSSFHQIWVSQVQLKLYYSSLIGELGFCTTPARFYISWKINLRKLLRFIQISHTLLGK